MKIGLVAGEASGDLLGAGLIRAIRKRVPDATFEGVAGPSMIAEGCDAWADAEELAIFGLLEPLVHLHPHFEIEGFFGFYGFYGFIGCVGLVLGAKALRVVLMRPEDYYDD